MMNYDIKHKILVTDDNKYKIVPKDRYHIPMYFNEHWERNVNSEQFMNKKLLGLSYVMNLDTMKDIKKGDMFSSRSFMVIYMCINIIY